MENLHAPNGERLLSRRQRLIAHWSTIAEYRLMHGELWRDFRPNLHRLGDQAWRSAQPSPWTIRCLRLRHGLRTVVNLRGDQHDSRIARIEREACDRLGVAYVPFKVKSREMPSRENLLDLRDLMAGLDYPVLFHCKSGADRAGLVSTLYLHWMLGVSIREARRQLSFVRYGHVSLARTGILDHVFSCYLDAIRLQPMDFTTWVRYHYDSESLARRFRANRMLSGAVSAILARE
jgi:protein tyrosine/serine phosphatase